MVDAGVLDADTVMVEPTSGKHRHRARLRGGGARPAADPGDAESMSVERRKMLALLGAELVLTPPISA